MAAPILLCTRSMCSMLSIFKRVVRFRYVDMLRSIFITFQHTDYIKICLYGTLSSINFATVDKVVEAQFEQACKECEQADAALKESE